MNERVQIPVSVVSRRRRAGQGLTEYAMIAGLIAVVCIASLSAIGVNTSEALGNFGDALSGETGPGLCLGATLQQHLSHCGCASQPHSCTAFGWSC